MLLYAVTTVCMITRMTLSHLSLSHVLVSVCVCVCVGEE